MTKTTKLLYFHSTSDRNIKTNYLCSIKLPASPRDPIGFMSLDPAEDSPHADSQHIPPMPATSPTLWYLDKSLTWIYSNQNVPVKNPSSRSNIGAFRDDQLPLSFHHLVSSPRVYLPPSVSVCLSVCLALCVFVPVCFVAD